MKSILFALLFSLSAVAETEKGTLEKITDKTAEVVQQTQTALDNARTNREKTKWSVIGNLSLIDTWIFPKYGITGSYNSTASGTWELEYLRGSYSFGVFGVDIGSITEQKLTLIRRSFSTRNSFNFLYGVFYDQIDISLGNEYLATVAMAMQSSVDVMKLATAGVTWGIGNRWQMQKGMVWGFDWLVLQLPLTTLKQETPFLDATSSSEQKDDAEDVLRVLRKMPMLTVIKMQLGYSF